MQVISKVYVALFLATIPSTVLAAAAADNDPAVIAIDAAIKSMKQHPNQFNVQLTCVAAQGIAKGGGTGINVTANGGGLGSTTTGMSVTMDSAQCNVAKGTALNTLNEQAAMFHLTFPVTNARLSMVKEIDHAVAPFRCPLS